MKFFLVLSLGLACAGPSFSQDSIWTAPAVLHPGDRVTVYFHSDRPVFARASTITGGFYSLDDKNRVVEHDITLKRSGDSWTAAANIPDTTYAIVANVARPDTDAYAAALAVGLDSSNGEPFLKTYQALANAYSPQQYPMGTQNNKKAGALRGQYWAGMTTEPATFGGKIYWFLTTKKDTASALNLITNLPLDSTAVEDDYDFGAYFAVMLRNKPLSTLLTNVRHKLYPQGTWRRYEYQQQMAGLAGTKDAAAVRALIRAYQKVYPNEKPEESLLPYLNSLLWQVQLLNGDLAGALATIPANASGLEKAETYNNIAWKMAICNIDIPQALALAKASLDTLLALEASGIGKPVASTGAQYKKDLVINYSLTADTYAYLLDMTGNYQEAFAYEKKSLADAGPNPDQTIIDNYHRFMEKVEKPSKVVSSLSTYIVKGQSDTAMEAQFKRLYKGSETPDDAYAALLVQAKALKKAEMVRTSLHDPASQFTLVDLDGKKVSLDSLKGKTVVVDFWATWCGPCKASFPAMETVIDHYKNDNNVAVLFVDTWEHGDDKKQEAKDFIKSHDYPFRVLMDNDNKVVAAYKVEGIPTKFVIDPAGVVRFKAVGFGGDPTAAAEELESMIEIARKD